ncbi:MAG TPA: RNA polymerase sigma factor [Polyangiaceae bacterium]
MNAAERKAIHDAIVRLADGDRSRVRPLLDMLWPILLAFARRGVGQEQDAEDVAQETFLRICSRASDFDRSRDGLSWAFGIAKYEILTHRRRLRRTGDPLDAPELALAEDPARSQEADLIARELELILEGVLGKLEQSDRAALGLGNIETPALPASAAARKRRQRALERLRSLWRKLYGEP